MCENVNRFKKTHNTVFLSLHTSPLKRVSGVANISLSTTIHDCKLNILRLILFIECQMLPDMFIDVENIVHRYSILILISTLFIYYNISMTVCNE